MARRFPVLDHLVERLARHSPPRHRELVRGMLVELDTIGDPDERTRFALGAIAAIARLSIRGYAQAAVQSPARWVGVLTSPDAAHPRGLSMPNITTRQLLRRHAMPFAVSCGSLTGLLLLRDGMRRASQVAAGGFSPGAIAETALLALPFTLALTIPMSVFIAVSWVFTRLGRQGLLTEARRERDGIRRLVIPVLGAAAVVAALTLVLNTQIVPRTNERFATLIASSHRQSDRTMTVGELREAARSARAVPGSEAAARAAAYEVEIQKKFALSAACMVLALAAAAFAILLPNGGMWLVLGASGLVFSSYFLILVGGESLADSQVISPFLAMWAANLSLLFVGVLLVWRAGRTGPRHGTVAGTFDLPTA